VREGMWTDVLRGKKWYSSGENGAVLLARQRHGVSALGEEV
jgi:hypothetical protein